MLARTLLFAIINFAALGLGGLFTSKGVSSIWYSSLQKAPWTPPGWVFGAAWTTIMICFAFFMALLWPKAENKQLLVGLFIAQWILNVLWNPVFFHYHHSSTGLLVIGLLTLLVGYFQFKFIPELNYSSLLVTPYLLWLIIATSLNGYIVFNN